MKINNIQQTQYDLDESLEIQQAREDCEQRIRSAKMAARLKIRKAEDEEPKLKAKDNMLKEHIECLITVQSLIN